MVWAVCHPLDTNCTEGLASCIDIGFREKLACSQSLWNLEDPYGPTLVQITDHFGNFTTPQRYSASPAGHDCDELLAILFPRNG